MCYYTKIAIVIDGSLAPWQKLNVACFLSAGLSEPILNSARAIPGRLRGTLRTARAPAYPVFWPRPTN